MDLLSELIEHLEPRSQPPVVLTFEGRWAFELPPGPPSIHLLRCGHCDLWRPGARHAMPLEEASLLFLSGATPAVLQARGSRLEPSGQIDLARGRALRRAGLPPDLPGAVQILSSRIEILDRGVSRQPLPDVAIVGARQVPLPRSYRPLLDSLFEEISFSRIGGDAIIGRLLDVFLIQALRVEVTSGVGVSGGWLGGLSDPVLRTCLDEQEELPTRDAARTLAAASLRSTRRLGARVKKATGTGVRALAKQRRLHRVLQLLDEGVHPLERVARETGFATVSNLCRAFRREVGSTPGAYWRRVQQRPLPRTPGSRNP